MSFLHRLPLLLTALATFGPAIAQDKTTQAPAAQEKVAARDDAAAERLGLRLSVQAWTFRDRTAFEAIDTAHALGLRYIELYPGQKMRPDSNAKVDVGMKAEDQKALITKLGDAKIKVVNFGVVGMANDEKKLTALFDFGKALGIETFTCEPDTEAWKLVDAMCAKYGIKAACHNHPQPSHYWNPETVAAVLKDRGAHCGSCADTGHWPRSGIDPVQGLKQLEGRVLTLHFKDIAPADKTGVDQPWGTGKGNARGQLVELLRQGFRGAISIEYETGSGKELEENVKKCIAWFDSTCKELEAKTGK